MAESIQIHVNGEERACRADATVGDLLRELAIQTERVAVELNLEIMDRKDFDHRSLKQGDRVEILGFIGGGAPVNIQGMAGCSKRLSSKAAASEGARRTLRYVEPLSDARTPLADFFSILLGRGVAYAE